MIKNLIDEYVLGKFDRWHTPGHGGRLNPRDITELMEEKYFPANRVTEAEKYCAELYGCKHLRFLTGGSSMGVKAAIMVAGGNIITGNNSHRAVAEGLELANASAHIIPCETRGGLSLALSIEQIENAIKAHPNAAAVLITSPDYYGNCALVSLAQVVHSHNKLLISDSAHGAHFNFCERLKDKSFSGIADFCNMSAHKTLNAYTQSAYLAINNDSLLNKCDHALQLLGTTSPSYLFFEQLEIAAQEGRTRGEIYEKLYNRITEFKRQVRCYDNDDFTRLVIDATALGLSGGELAQKLFSKNIMSEMYDARYVVLIANAFTTNEMFNHLEKAIKLISRQEDKSRK